MAQDIDFDTYGGEGYIGTIDESDDDYVSRCPAEVTPFQPCGKKMRRRQNGSTVCSIHGEMH